jgi:hypothetical protein
VTTYRVRVWGSDRAAYVVEVEAPNQRAAIRDARQSLLGLVPPGAHGEVVR